MTKEEKVQGFIVCPLNSPRKKKLLEHLYQMYNSIYKHMMSHNKCDLPLLRFSEIF